MVIKEGIGRHNGGRHRRRELDAIDAFGHRIASRQCRFLAFAAYVLGEVASNASDRNRTQTELITKLVTDIRDCRQGPKT